jgi:hypothetical protein
MKSLVILVCLVPLALAQEKKMRCDDEWNDNGHYCEMREATMPATGSLDVDGGANGGISVKAANRSDILVRSKIQTNRRVEEDSRQLAPQVRVETAGGSIRAVGPSENGHQEWSVSFEILAPQHTNLELHTQNGGIHISGVEGNIRFEAVNGGVNLERLAGSVEGHTVNGGVHLVLANDHWEGDQCQVTTTNGGVTILVPANYSAHLETGTVNGGIALGFPVTVQGEMRKQISVDLGSGGKLVRATTTNGGISVKHISGST